MQPPVALERLQALACARVPELHRLVPARTGEQPVNGPVYAVNSAAAIFSNVSFTGTTLRLSPPESTPLPR